METSINTIEIGSIEPKLAELTDCERKFLLLLANDLTNGEIAEELCLTLKSVENYKTKIGDKLNMKGRDKLARFARKHPIELHHWHKQQVNPPPRKSNTNNDNQAANPDSANDT